MQLAFGVVLLFLGILYTLPPYSFVSLYFSLLLLLLSAVTTESEEYVDGWY